MRHAQFVASEPGWTGASCGASFEIASTYSNIALPTTARSQGMADLLREDAAHKLLDATNKASQGCMHANTQFLDLVQGHVPSLPGFPTSPGGPCKAKPRVNQRSGS